MFKESTLSNELLQNLLCSPHFICSIHLETPQQAMALLNRGIVEQSACLKWLLWPLDFHSLPAESWTFSKQIWRVLFIPAFKRGDGLIRVSFLRIVLTLLETNSFSDGELLQIAISVAAFTQVIRDSTPTQEGLDRYMHLISAIEHQLFLQNPEQVEAIQKYFSEQQKLINAIIETGDRNAMSHYATQMDVTLTQLTQLPPDMVVGDWMLNFFFVYRQILPEFPDLLLKKAFSFTLLRRATDEGICAILDLFRQVGVSEDTRLVLQQFLPSERITRLCKLCSASLAKVTHFVPFDVRRAHFLASSRGFAEISITYRLPESARNPEVNLMSLLAAVRESEIDIFESQNIFINGRSLKTVIEVALSTFAKVPHWSIPGPNGTFFPSPVLQPGLLVALISLMMRCRQLNCQSSLKLAKEFFTAEVSEIKTVIALYLIDTEDPAWPVIHDGYLQLFDAFISANEVANSNALISQVELERAWNAVLFPESDVLRIGDQFYQAFEKGIEKIVQLQIDASNVALKKDLEYFEKNEYFKVLFE